MTPASGRRRPEKPRSPGSSHEEPRGERGFFVSGTAVQVGGGVYEVALDDGRVVEASLRGRLKQEARTGDRVVIGDRVRMAEAEDGGWTVEGIEPRRTEIARKAPGGRKAKVVAANVDRLVAVVAAAAPEPRRETIDRLLVIAEANDVEPVLVVNKVDLPGGREISGRLVELYGGLGYRVVRTSAQAGEGLDALSEVLCAGTSALVGPSGVGKSSLLNALQPGLSLRTAEVSRRRGSGRHTTVSARLLPLDCGGRVADTPGFSDVGLWNVEAGELDLCFPEMVTLRESCRFRACTHIHEPGCAVREAVGDTLDSGRYASYRILREEAVEEDSAF